MERAGLSALLRATGCARECGRFVFMCDPRWTGGERAQLEAFCAHAESGEVAGDEGWLCIPTGGTTGGGLKFARHDERTVGAAVRGFAKHFSMERVNAVDVLPPFHVSGLMARIRCAVTGGTHVAWDWRRLEGGARPEIDPARGAWTISLVPTQLQRVLASAEATAWLRRFAIVLIGGGPAWATLTDAAAGAGLRISLSYGMTETAAMVTALRPEEFAGGDRSSGAPLPHARVTLGRDGTICVEGASVFRGYFPERTGGAMFATEDLGAFDERGRLHVRGRRDAVIITGGEKVNTSEVEAALRATGEFEDVAVIGVPDDEWGEAVVACYPAMARRCPDLVRVEAELVWGLAGFKRPKRFVAVASWPRNAQGKLSRAKLEALMRGEPAR